MQDVRYTSDPFANLTPPSPQGQGGDPSAGSGAPDATPQPPAMLSATNGNYTSDPFANLTPAPPADTADPGAFTTGVENFQRSFQKLSDAGIKAMGADPKNMQIQSLVPDQGLAALSNSVIAPPVSKDKLAADSSLHPIAAFAGGLAGDAAIAAPFAAATGGGSLGYMMKTGAAIGSSLSGVDAYGQNQPVFPAMVTGGITGAGAGLVGAAMGTLWNLGMNKGGTGMLSKMFNSKAAAEQTIYNASKQTPEGAQGVINAGQDAKDLGVNDVLTPGQQIGTDNASTVFNNVTPISDPKKLDMAQGIFGADKKVKGMLTDTIDKLDTTTNGEKITDGMRNEAYDQLKPMALNPEDAKLLSNNPIIAKYTNELNQSGIKPASLADDNIYKLNEVKKNMSTDLMRKTDLGATEQAELRQGLNDLGTALKNSGGDAYTNANMLAQRQIIKQTVDDALLKTGKSGTLQDLYNTLFESKGQTGKIQDFVKAVGDAGGDAPTTQKLINVIGQMSERSSQNVADGLVGGAPHANPSVGGNIAGIIQRFSKNFIQGNYNSEMMKLMTPGSGWENSVKALMAKENNMPALMSGLHSLLNQVKSGAGTAGRAGLLGLGQKITDLKMNNSFRVGAPTMLGGDGVVQPQ